MNSGVPKNIKDQVTLLSVNRDNWREVARLEVNELQREFVAEPTYYL